MKDKKVKEEGHMPVEPPRPAVPAPATGSGASVSSAATVEAAVAGSSRGASLGAASMNGQEELYRLKKLHRLYENLEEQMRVYKRQVNPGSSSSTPSSTSWLPLEEASENMYMRALSKKRELETSTSGYQTDLDALDEPWKDLLGNVVKEVQMELAENYDKIRQLLSNCPKPSDITSRHLSSLGPIVKQIVAINYRHLANLCVIASKWSSCLAEKDFKIVYDFIEADFPLAIEPWGIVLCPSGYISFIQDDGLCEHVGIGDYQTRVFQGFYDMLSRLEDLLTNIVDCAARVDKDISAVMRICLQPEAQASSIAKDIQDMFMSMKAYEDKLLQGIKLPDTIPKSKLAAYLAFHCTNEAMAWLQKELFLDTGAQKKVNDSDCTPLLGPWQAAYSLSHIQKAFNDSRIEDLLYRTRFVEERMAKEAKEAKKNLQKSKGPALKKSNSRKAVRSVREQMQSRFPNFLDQGSNHMMGRPMQNMMGIPMMQRAPNFEQLRVRHPPYYEGQGQMYGMNDGKGMHNPQFRAGQMPPQPPFRGFSMDFTNAYNMDDHEMKPDLHKCRSIRLDPQSKKGKKK